jgi:ankyrin repeat protein
LVYAVVRNHPEMVPILLAGGAEANIEFHIESLGDLTPLSVSTFRGDRDTVLVLLEHGAEVDALSDIAGYGLITPLMLAVRRGHTEVVDVLLQRGADPNWVDEEEQTPLDRARARAAAQLVALLESAVTPTGSGARSGSPP